VSGTNGTTVSYLAAGSCVIDANQAGDASYSAAPQVTQTIAVDQAPAFVADSPPLCSRYRSRSRLLATGLCRRAI